MGSHVGRHTVVMCSHVRRHRVVIDSHVGRKGSSLSTVKCGAYELPNGQKIPLLSFKA